MPHLTMALYPRDIVFECPCQAEWAPTGAGESGEMTLTFGVRSYRATRSGEVALRSSKGWEDVATLVHTAASPAYFGRALWGSVGEIPAGAVVTDLSRTHGQKRPSTHTPLAFLLNERIAEVPPPSESEPYHYQFVEWFQQETLVLWPVPGEAGSGRLRFVDILTDSDGDGVGDVNERLAGTLPYDNADMPGVSTVDVLPLYDDAVVEAFGDLLFTWIHHEMALANAIFADSGTNIRLRSVGAKHVQLNEALRIDDYDAVMEPVGADMFIQYYAEESPCGGNFSCASIPFDEHLGFVVPGRVFSSLGGFSALGTTHELGHALGALRHSARQGEAAGTFRWSRGHYIGSLIPRSRVPGTVMSYANNVEILPVFSNPDLDCLGFPCGVPSDAPAGADAAASLDLVRFQIAGWRPAKPDSDGDGFVDPADALPDDPDDWLDTDGDGRGDNADPDDDNDGVPDVEDAFSRNPAEWADADGDGVGDNADDDVVDLSPFKDPALRALVEEALGKAPGAPIGEDELAGLTSLGESSGHGSGMGIRDLTGLELAVNLEELRLKNHKISDLRPLSGLTQLRGLDIQGDWLEGGGPITDLSPLSGLTALEWLNAEYNVIADLSPLPGLTGLKMLLLTGNPITDLSPLSGLTALEWLQLERSAVSDLSPLSGLTRIRWLRLWDNRIADLSPLRGLNLEALFIGRNKVTLDDVAALPNFRNIQNLDLRTLGLKNISALSELTNAKRLNLDFNAISDVSPLAALAGVQSLQLRASDISDIGPLVNRSMWWNGGRGALLDLVDNPLSDASVRQHIPTLESWGIRVLVRPPISDANLVDIPDPALRALIGQTKAWRFTNVDDPITVRNLDGTLPQLKAFRAGISDLTGLEAAPNLRGAFLKGNAIVDLTPLEGLPLLGRVDLSDNLITDIAPLVNNPGLGEDNYPGQPDWVSLGGNPLSEESVNVHIPSLLARGVVVALSSVRLTFAARGDTITFDTAGYFAALLGGDMTMTVAVSDPIVAEASIRDGVLTVRSMAAGGAAAVTVTATDEHGEIATLVFDVEVPVVGGVPLFPQAADPVRQGFVRTNNRSDRPGNLRVEAIDDAGTRRDPVTLVVGAAEAVHFNSNDLEDGNTWKGLSGAIGAGSGDWRLALRSGPNLETLSYIRTEDGFLTAMHDRVPMTGAGHRVATFNPASNRNQVSLLRLVNPTTEPATVTITGVDDEGVTPGNPVSLSLDAGAARTISARELESGADLDGALGDGSGKWRLTVKSDRRIEVASLLESPTGHLTNLSTVPDNKAAADGEVTIHHVPLFLSAADPKGRQGFVRVVNRGSEDATVQIKAYDDSDWDYDPVVLRVEAGKARHFNSLDLEMGNVAKGLSGGVGSGQGNWRLELGSDADIDVLAYVRTEDGFLTAMHDVASLADDGYRVPIFNPGGNPNQVSSVRLVNPGSEDAEVTITGMDDRGFAPGTGVFVTVPAGASRTFTAAELETGGDGTKGALGDGVGKWRLLVESEQSIVVMSLLASPTGHLTNLSTVPSRGAAGLPP